VFAQSERAVAFELVNTNLAPPVQPTVPPLSGHDTIATYGLAWSPLHRRLFGELSITSSLAPTSLQAEIAESDAALRDIRARIDRHLERYGERHYVAGYRPSLHCGFPEFPIEL
jgi:hypothetical protein